MATRPYHPITAPAVLAPTSRPNSPASSSTFERQATALASKLAAADAPRRRSGLIHHAPPSAGSTRLVCTAVKGEWGGRRPPWVRMEATEAQKEVEQDEEKAWTTLGMEGLPSDMDEWKRWEEKKAGWRVQNATRRSHDAQEEISVILSSSHADGAAQGNQRRRQSRRSASPARLVESLPAPARQPKLNSLFSASKSTVSTPSSSNKSKKRPPTSPVPPPPARHASTSSSSKRSSRDGGAKETSETSAGPEESGALNGGGRSNGRSLGEEEEILFEGGCTQMELPSPTPHLAPGSSQQTLAPPSNRHQPSSPAHSGLQPFSSPGPALLAPLAASTPYPCRAAGGLAPPASPSPSRSPNHSPPPEPLSFTLPKSSLRPPPSQAPSYGTAAMDLCTSQLSVAAAQPKLRRISSIARSDASSFSLSYAGVAALGGAGGSGGSGKGRRGKGEGEREYEDISRFLEEDSRD